MVEEARWRTCRRIGLRTRTEQAAKRAACFVRLDQVAKVGRANALDAVDEVRRAERQSCAYNTIVLLHHVCQP